jgi:hypothetical protein
MKTIEQVGWDHEEVMRQLRTQYAEKIAEMKRLSQDSNRANNKTKSSTDNIREVS